MTIKHLRLATASTLFTETECLDCEQVIAVSWQYLHHNMALASPPITRLTTCPMCGSVAVQTRLVDKVAFESITKAWDLLGIGDVESTVLTENSDNVIDLSNLFEADND